MDEHPLHCCTTDKPSPDSRVKLFMEDGSPLSGIWTGTQWQVDGQRVSPVSWQPPYGEEV